MDDFNIIKDTALDQALYPDPNNQRLSRWQATTAGVDARSGNISMRDRNTERLRIGNILNNEWAIVIVKEGYNVKDEVSD